jgi:hypothetical protein
MSMFPYFSSADLELIANVSKRLVHFSCFLEKKVGNDNGLNAGLEIVLYRCEHLKSVRCINDDAKIRSAERLRDNVEWLNLHTPL